MMNENEVKLSIRLDEQNQNILSVLKKDAQKINKNISINNLLKQLIKIYYKENFLYKNNNIEDEIISKLIIESGNDVLTLIENNINYSYQLIMYIDYIFNQDIKIYDTNKKEIYF